MKKLRCLCCGYRTIEVRGRFEICPICFWEDDPYILYGNRTEEGYITAVFTYNDCDSEDYDGSDVLDLESGTNHLLTLRQGRKNFRKFGACDEDYKEFVRFPRSSEMKRWRKENRIINDELVFAAANERINNMSYKLNKKLVNLVPYDPIMGTYKIRLDANESCFDLSDSLKDKICEAIKKVDFNRYPDCLSKLPTEAFAKLYNISPDLVTAGNGSDELISVITSCFFETGDTLVNVSHDFSMYGFYAQLYEVNVETYQKEADLTINADKLIAFCKEKKARGLVFSNPCNPTSLGLERDDVRKIITSLEDTLVILDEAYMDFWDQSLLDEVEKYSNLLILKTCSKAIGMAAVRCGFAIANKTITTALRAAKSPYNNDSVAQTIVSVMLNEKEWLTNCREVIVSETKKLYDGIMAINEKYNAFEAVYKPCTNFVFIKSEKSKEIYEYLLENSIAIRFFGGNIRITAGTPEENAEVLAVLEKFFTK